jgi:hypothetical protein
MIMLRSKYLAAIVALGAASAVSLGATSAHAFCRTHALDSATRAKYPDATLYEQVCPRDAAGCCAEFPVVFWKNACVGYSLQEGASAYVPFEQASPIVARSFARWPAADCDGRGAHPSIKPNDLGPVACDEVKYDERGANQNVIVFRDERGPGSAPSLTLGLTTITYVERTGEIVDADMEINSANFRYVASDARALPLYDLEAVISHEAGHFYGLAHSQDSSALMNADYERSGGPGHELGPDDVAGICTIYAPDGRRSVDKAASTSGFLAAVACDPTPRRGLTSACVGAAQSKMTTTTACCTVAPGAARGGGLEAGALVLAGAAVLRLRRRRS